MKYIITIFFTFISLSLFAQPTPPSTQGTALSAYNIIKLGGGMTVDDSTAMVGWIKDSLNTRVKYLDTATMLYAYSNAINTKAASNSPTFTGRVEIQSSVYVNTDSVSRTSGLKYLYAIDTTTGRSYIQAQIDTSVFARKNMTAYSMRANNTASAADGSYQSFRTVGETAFAASDSVAWAGSSAPSGSTNNTYRWTQIGNRVWLDATLSNTSNGTGITGISFKLPPSLPTPAEPTGQTAASTYMYPVNAVFISSTNAVLSGAARGGLRNNSNNNAYEVAVTTSSIAPCTALISLSYTTN